MYNNPYMQYTYNPQMNIERINNQIAELEKMKNQISNSPITTPTNLTQNFQIAPTHTNTIKYANNINEVQKEMVIGDTPYFSKDLSVVWIKNSQGEIKTYELSEIVEKDEKDIQIELLMSEIEELKGKIENVSNVTNVNAEQNATNTSTNDGSIGTTIKKSESTGLSRISTSKKK